jgi:hypothetical protein
MRPKLSISASKGAGNAAQAAGENSGPRHDHNHVRLPFLHGDPPRRTVQPCRRIPELLAPVLRQDIRSVSSGTALYARPGSGLARQAHGAVGPALHLITSDIQAAAAFRGRRRFFEAPGACAPKRCARPCRFPDGALAAVIIAMNGPPHDAAALCNSR